MLGFGADAQNFTGNFTGNFTETFNGTTRTAQNEELWDEEGITFCTLIAICFAIILLCAFGVGCAIPQLIDIFSKVRKARKALKQRREKSPDTSVPSEYSVNPVKSSSTNLNLNLEPKESKKSAPLVGPKEQTEKEEQRKPKKQDASKKASMKKEVQPTRESEKSMEEISDWPEPSVKPPVKVVTRSETEESNDEDGVRLRAKRTPVVKNQKWTMDGKFRDLGALEIKTHNLIAADIYLSPANRQDDANEALDDVRIDETRSCFYTVGPSTDVFVNLVDEDDSSIMTADIKVASVKRF